MRVADAATLIEVLAERADRQPERPACRLAGGSLSFAGLWSCSGRFATALSGHGVTAGDRVVLSLPNSLEFFPCFYGTLRAGAVSVPVFPGSGPQRIAQIAGLCGAAAIVVPDTARQDEVALLTDLAGGSCPVLTTAAAGPEPGRGELPSLSPDDVCFIQYTSGSTGNPKGVQLSHDNLLTNVRQMIAGMEITEQEVFVSWLPVYHDMGLILMTMVPFYLAAELILLPTSLLGIRRWMSAIHEHRGSFTAAPDFAYRLSLRYVRDPASYDLSCLRVALNAAEPVRAATIEEFESTFGLHGVMVPGYGLAEATVGVSMWPAGSRPKVHGRGLVALGRPFPGVEMRIADDSGPVEPGVTGEIQVRSPAASRGYFRNPQETAALSCDDGFLHTGDLGLADHEGEIYFVGRSKNIIIHGGQNIAPQEVEETVDELEFVRSSAAIGVDRGRIEGEQVYVFVELRAAEAADPECWQELAIAVVSCFHERLGFRPGRVYLLAPRSIPLTHNGKVQHALLKEHYLDGSLHSSGRILFPEY